MKAILAIVFVLPTLAWAQQRREVLEQRVEFALRTARLSVQQNLKRMTIRELQQTETLLGVVTDIANAGNTPFPGPIPYPAILCAQDQVEIYQSTFVEIKKFANDVINKTSSQSLEYAHDWTSKYPCQIASKFMMDFSRIKEFAYNDLNKTSSQSIQYAEAMIDKVCSDVKFEENFRGYKNFAYNTLNMTLSNAINYALPRVEAEAFICQNF